MKTFLNTLIEVWKTCLYLVFWAVSMLYLAMSLTEDGILHYYGIIAVVFTTAALVIHIKGLTNPFKKKKS